MTIIPLKVTPLKDRATQPPALSRKRQTAPHPGRIARRRFLVRIAKRLLPLAALALLASVALWPELSKDATTARVAFRRGMVEPESGQLTQARYNGVDDTNRRYTVTADTARQVTQERINLTSPVGDVTLENGVWLHGKAQNGVYMQQTGVLDLSGNVILYRDDGITLQTDVATIDLKSNVAASASMVHAEGPFGTLDAQGFTLLDGGSTIQFIGPSRLLLNGAKK
jgi:lipopolysaccharide export system protein LptC